MSIVFPINRDPELSKSSLVGLIVLICFLLFVIQFAIEVEFCNQVIADARTVSNSEDYLNFDMERVIAPDLKPFRLLEFRHLPRAGNIMRLIKAFS